MTTGTYMPTLHAKPPAKGHDNYFWCQHENAIMQPRYGVEMAIVQSCNGLAQYVEGYAAECPESRIADDGVLGDDWADWFKATRGLLNGPTGRLDCGTVDGYLVKLWEAAGYDQADL